MRKGDIFQTPLRERNEDDSFSNTQYTTSIQTVVSGGSNCSKSDDHRSGGSRNSRNSYHSGSSRSSSSSSSIVKVRAPADLPSGYTFKASLGGRTIVAVVVSGRGQEENFTRRRFYLTFDIFQFSLI